MKLRTKLAGGTCATVAGLLLFGTSPNRRLPQAGVSAVAFPGTEKDYNTTDEERIRGPLISYVTEEGAPVHKGVIDQTIDFVKRNMGSEAWLEGARRIRKASLPIEAVREAVGNALAHRDYWWEGTDVEVSLYADRLEVISPGGLPNGVTVEKMREGVVRVARNELLKEILRDYRYIEHYGMGRAQPNYQCYAGAQRHAARPYCRGSPIHRPPPQSPRSPPTQRLKTPPCQALSNKNMMLNRCL